MKNLVLIILFIFLSCEKDKEPIHSSPKSFPNEINLTKENRKEIQNYIKEVKIPTSINLSHKELIKEYGSLNYAFWLSIILNDQKKSKSFLQMGAEINTYFKGSGTALLMATRIKNIDLIKFLVLNGADINIRGDNGETALSLIAGSDDIELAEFLIDNGANFLRGGDKINKVYSILTVPISMRRVKMLDLLLSKGASPNAGGAMALNFSIMMKEKSFVKKLLSHGANPNLKGAQGLTPMMVAAIENDKSIITLLIDNGGDPFIKDENNKNAFDWAKKHKSNGDQTIKNYLKALNR